MATVTHGMKDGIDEILEKARAIERILNARAASVEDDGKLAIIDEATREVVRLREQATVARAAIDNVRKSLRDH
jgi:type II secretory pathway component PulM